MRKIYCEDINDTGKVWYGENFPRYNVQAMPLKQNKFWTFLITLVSKFALIGKKYTIEKIGMEDLKPPYILLSNHMYFIDFELAAQGTFPHSVNNITSIDGYYRRPLIMELIGCICKRKFTSDPSLVKAAKKVLHEYKDVLCMYPEARYTPIGTLAVLPDSLGKLVKEMGNIPVVVITHHGNHLMTPFWNFRKPRKVPLHMTMKKVLDGEQVGMLSAAEIQTIITEAMQYDEYKWQKENNIKIDEPYRAEGLEKVLYKCPCCMQEGKMSTAGATLKCDECGASWLLSEYGELIGKTGIEKEKGFSHVPDWFEWERSCVRKEIEDGTYSFEDEVDVFSLPNPRKFIHLGNARFTHSIKDGITIEGEYNNRPYKIRRGAMGMYSLHVEYDYCYLKPEDCVDVSTNDDSFYCYPSKKNVVTKLSFAVEEIYKFKKAQRALKKAKSEENS